MTNTLAPVTEPMTEEDLSHQRQAFALLSRHDHGGPFADRDDANLCRANCGACVLDGYQDRDDTEHHEHDGPNYAGWARIYVQARRTIPRKWLAAFDRELARTDNPAYTEGLRRDLAVFGDPRPIVPPRHTWVANGCKCHVVCMNCSRVSHNDPHSKVTVGRCGAAG